MFVCLFVCLFVAHDVAQLRNGTKQAKTYMCERQLAQFKLLYPLVHRLTYLHSASKQCVQLMDFLMLFSSDV